MAVRKKKASKKGTKKRAPQPHKAAKVSRKAARSARKRAAQ